MKLFTFVTFPLSGDVFFLHFQAQPLIKITQISDSDNDSDSYFQICIAWPICRAKPLTLVRVSGRNYYTILLLVISKLTSETNFCKHHNQSNWSIGHLFYLAGCLDHKVGIDHFPYFVRLRQLTFLYSKRNKNEYNYMYNYISLHIINNYWMRLSVISRIIKEEVGLFDRLALLELLYFISKMLLLLLASAHYS